MPLFLWFFNSPFFQVQAYHQVVPWKVIVVQAQDHRHFP